MYTRRKSRVGVVTSDKMQKTDVVAVESRKRHPLYNKTIRRTTRYKVHDANEVAKLGDVVRILESRPLSREKRWRLAEVVTRREVAEIAPREIDASMLGIKRLHREGAAATAEAPPAEAVAAPVAEAVEAPADEEAPPAAESEPEAPPAEAVAEPVAEAVEAPADEEAPPAAESEPEAPSAEAVAEPAAPVESEGEAEPVSKQEEEQTEK